VTILKLYYDGWLALPPAALQQLGVSTGGVLEAELADDGTILLRPVAKSLAENQQHQALPGDAAAHQPGTVPGVAEEASVLVKRKRGRPRTVAAAEPLQAASTTHEPQGALPTAAPHPEQEPAPVAGARPPSELRRKVALPVSLLDHVPARGRRPERLLAGTGYEREERRPFPHVEVRKLGPGRGHNKAHRCASDPRSGPWSGAGPAAA
jgi:hypothetical protein